MEFSDRIKATLKMQGRSRKWLAAKLDFTYKTFYVKMLNDSFSVSETFYIKHILNLED